MRSSVATPSGSDPQWSQWQRDRERLGFPYRARFPLRNLAPVLQSDCKSLRTNSIRMTMRVRSAASASVGGMTTDTTRDS